MRRQVNTIDIGDFTTTGTCLAMQMFENLKPYIFHLYPQ